MIRQAEQTQFTCKYNNIGGSSVSMSDLLLLEYRKQQFTYKKQMSIINWKSLQKQHQQV